MLRVADRGDCIVGLVEGEIDQALGSAQQPPIDLDVVAFEIRLGAQLGDYGAVHGDAPFADHLFGVAARSHPRLRQDFLQPLRRHHASEGAADDSLAGSPSANASRRISSNSLSEGSSLRSFNPNWRRNSLVVLYRIGLPITSLRPAVAMSLRSSSVLITPAPCTPRISRISGAVTGCL